MGDSCLAPPVGICLSLSVNEGWGEGRGLGYLSQRLCYIPEKGRGGGNGGGVVQRVVEKNTDACQQPLSWGAIMPCVMSVGQ